MSQPILTISIIVRDEMKHLPSLFASLRLLRQNMDVQVVCVDTGSTDGTAGYAEGQGAEVPHFEWVNDFSRARNFGLGRCRGRWILWLDADDVVPPDTSAWLQKNLNRLNPDYVYLFKVVSPGADGSSSSFLQTRLFPGGKNICFSNPVHESLTPSIRAAGMTGVSTGCEIRHMGYADGGMMETKITRNRTILESQVSSGESSPAVLFSLARTYQGLQRYADALPLLNRVIQNPEAQILQGDVYLASHIYYGQTLAFLDRLVEARAFFEIHSEKGKAHPQFLFERAKVLMVLGWRKDAADMFARVLKLQPLDWTVPTDWDAIFQGAKTLLEQCASAEGPQAPSPPAAELSEAELMRHISICSIIKDEAGHIGELCRRLPLEQVEWIVVDTGSTDGSPGILKTRGVRVLDFPWCDDFSAARNFSLASASRPIVLWLDADDRLPENFWKDLAAGLSGRLGPAGELSGAARFIIESPRDTGGNELFRQIRLFPNHRGVLFEGKIHEQLGSSLEKNGIPVFDLEVKIIHKGYYTESDRRQKQDRNFRLLRDEIARCPDDPVVVMEYGNALYQQELFRDSAETYMGLLSRRGLSLRSPAPVTEVLRSYPMLIGEALDKAGAPDEAQDWFQTALLWSPEHLFPAYWLGKRALEQNDLQKALGYFRPIADAPLSVGTVASDQHTVRHNALGFLTLCEMKLSPRDDTRIMNLLDELVQMGLQAFPIDHRTPVEYYRNMQAWDKLENYFRAYLFAFPADTGMWEDLLELLIRQDRFDQVRALYESSPQIHMKSGIIEAFYGKSLESRYDGMPIPENNRPHEVYTHALHRFSEDPSLLFYFSEWTNRSRNYKKAFQDIKQIGSPSAELERLAGQLASLI